jgi:hypothetical protein
VSQEGVNRTLVEIGHEPVWRDYSDQATLMAGVPQWWLDHIGQFTAADFGARDD